MNFWQRDEGKAMADQDEDDSVSPSPWPAYLSQANMPSGRNVPLRIAGVSSYLLAECEARQPLRQPIARIGDARRCHNVAKSDVDSGGIRTTRVDAFMCITW